MNNLATINQPTLPVAKPSLGLTPQSIDEAIRLAEIMSKSNIVPKDYMGNPGNILVAIQWGAEIGLPPLQAMQNIACINGRPSVWGDAVLAIIRGSGALESITEDVSDKEAVCTVKRRGEPPVSRSFSMDDAKRAGLAGKSGPWQQYPKRMLQMRARAWALRDVFPDVLRGVHVAEEAQDMPVERPMGQAQVVDEPPAASRTEAVKNKLAGKRKAEEPAVTLDQVLGAIEAATDASTLKTAGKLVGQLADEAERAQAIEAGTRRRAELDAPPAEDFAKARDGIAASTSQEDIDGWLDWARDSEMSEMQREQLGLLAEARTAAIGF